MICRPKFVEHIVYQQRRQTFLSLKYFDVYTYCILIGKWELISLTPNDLDWFESALGLRARIKKISKIHNKWEWICKKDAIQVRNATQMQVLKLMFFHLLFYKLHSHSERGWNVVDALVRLLSSFKSHKPLKAICCMKSYCKYVGYSSQVCIFDCLVECSHTSLLICFQIWSSILVIWTHVHKKMCVCIGNPQTPLVRNREVWDLLL